MKRIIVGVLCLPLVAALALAAWLATSLPLTGVDGQAAGISAPVEIIRDEHGVPHIFAENDADAYFGLGLVHAQDRFWQMEMMRRLGAGRLAEVLGPAAVDSDKWNRLLGLYGLAEKMVDQLPDDVRAALEAYARGVNHWMAEDMGLLAPEFALFRYRPEPWRPADSLVWGKIMAARLGGNWRGEVLRARLAGKLSPERVRELWPAYPKTGPVTLGALDAGWTARQLAGLLEIPHAPLLRPMGAPKGASNAWAVSPDVASTGGAILANDPHLGFSAPVLWYLARIEAPGWRITGATVPGVPFTILGHTNAIAWGMTTTQADIEDLFIEKLDTRERDRYVTPDGSRPFYRRKEVIRVNGAADITFEVRATQHGPVISDLRTRAAAMAGDDHVVTLAATYLGPEDRSPVAFYQLSRANNWISFRRALRDYTGPQQNFLYADTAGQIGFISAGRVPVRGAGHGYVPTAGWMGETDWTGFIPFDELPQSAEAGQPYILNANNKITDDNYQHFLGFDWAPPFRAIRIRNLLAHERGRTVEDVTAMQRDVTSLMSRELLELMQKTVPKTAAGRDAIALLRNWDGAMDGARPEPLIFSAWLLELNRQLYTDELGGETPAYLGARPLTVISMLTRRQGWCDNVRTAKAETCDDILSASLDSAVTQLIEQHGDAPGSWRWDDVHRARFPHPVLTHAPVLNWLVDLSVPTPGGNATINRGAMRFADPEAPFAHIHGAGYRAVYDLKEPHRSRFSIATGQSGNPLSTHYRDKLTPWSNGQYFTLGQTRTTLRQLGAASMRIEPMRGK